MKIKDRDTFAGVDELGSAVETLGIERVSPIARSRMRIFDNFTTWLACNLVMPTLATGSLAIGVFGLGLWDSIAVIVVFKALGISPVAFSTLLLSAGENDARRDDERSTQPLLSFPLVLAKLLSFLCDVSSRNKFVSCIL